MTSRHSDMKRKYETERPEPAKKATLIPDATASFDDFDLLQQQAPQLSVVQRKVDFGSLPYDLRFMLWRKTLKDSSRVLKAAARVISTSSQSHSGSSTNDFILDISPSEGDIAAQASVWFGPDIRENPKVLSEVLESNKAIIRGTENIVFIESLPELLKPVFEELSKGNQEAKWNCENYSSKPAFSLHPSCPGIKGLALYAFTDSSHNDYYGVRDLKLYEDYIVSLLYCLVDLQIVYVVLDTKYDPAITPFKKPRFVNGTTGFMNMRHSDAADPINFETHEMQVKAVAAYQCASKLKSIIVRGISERNEVAAACFLLGQGPECPKRKFDIKIVQWEEDDINTSDEMKRRGSKGERVRHEAS